jgi:hypothetical protein
MSSSADLPDDDFLAVNLRSIAKLQRKHPEHSATEVARALRQAQERMEHSSGDRIIAAASLLLNRHPPAR